MERLTVLYNSVCPVCRDGICHFERRARTGTDLIDYVDVSRTPERYLNRSISLEDVRLKLHAIEANGQILKGWPAIAEIWRRTPGYGWLAQLGSLPGLSFLSRSLYHVTAHMLWRWNRICGRW
tara:strand:- start:374 stop:742 length:369 start_codon:yes stop_codon:yes gene_type:complete